MNTQIIQDGGDESKARGRKSKRNADHWYPRNAQDFFDGTRELSPEARGLYNDIVDMIYMYGGALRLSDRVIAGKLVVHVNKWLHIRQQLLDADKIFLTPEGWIHNKRAEEVLTARQEANNRRATSARPRRNLGPTTPPILKNPQAKTMRPRQWHPHIRES